MIRGTTPRLVFEFKHSVDFVKDLRVSFSQGEELKVEKTKEDAVLEGNTIAVRLTQEDTLLFEEDVFLKVQLKVLTTEGDVLATDEYSVMVKDILNEEILK